MKRTILGVVGGLIAWMAIGFIGGLIIRATWPEYVAVADNLDFTLSMKIVRLVLGAIATLGAGWVTVLIARSTMAALTPGIILLVAFIPQHIMLWDKFPLWYHLTFLLTLVPLSYLGGKLQIGASVRSDAAPSAMG
ncbi:MAG TPA: hypothetical protein VK629_03295 [Steroidobacteraceae bacterium]|nr:hypothetical protein [Steroidobacteraceae bacterium]